MTADLDVRCADGCGRLATTERLVGLADPALLGESDVVPVVELVCVLCAAGEPACP